MKRRRYKIVRLNLVNGDFKYKVFKTEGLLPCLPWWFLPITYEFTSLNDSFEEAIAHIDIIEKNLYIKSENVKTIYKS